MTSPREKLIAQQIDTFPILPHTVSRILTVTANPESSSRDLMEVILPDQSLCLTVLKVANSVLFGRPKRVDSLNTAITILGFDEVRSIALSKAVINSFGEIAGSRRKELDQFWEHAFLTAMVAKRIAQHLRYSQGNYFIGGLLHDIGKLVMLLTFTDLYDPTRWMSGPSDQESLNAEKRIFSFSHDTVAAQLLQKWLFPDTLLAAVEFHHHPECALQQTIFAHVIQLADQLAHLSCGEQGETEPNLCLQLQLRLPDLEIRWRRLGLPWKTELIELWYAWLLTNREQGGILKSMFRA